MESQVCNDCTYSQNSISEVLSEDVRLSMPLNEYCVITLGCVHAHQYLFQSAIIAHAKLYRTSQLHANTLTSVLS